MMDSLSAQQKLDRKTWTVLASNQGFFAGVRAMYPYMRHAEQPNGRWASLVAAVKWAWEFR